MEILGVSERTIHMGLLKHKTEGGSGGKRGHSNMSHSVYSHEIKEATKKRRRLEAKQVAYQARTSTYPDT